MPVPDPGSRLLPLLQSRGYEATYKLSDFSDTLADGGRLTASDRADFMLFAAQIEYRNRIEWASTYRLKRASPPSRPLDLASSAPRGNEILASPPQKLNVGYTSAMLSSSRSMARTERSKFGDNTSGGADQV